MKHYLVLGAKVKNGEPSRVLRSRLELVSQIAEHGSVIVFSGRDECHVMRRWMEENGNSSYILVEEDKAGSTNENLEYAHALYPNERFTVVTSDFHRLRTLMWAWHLGLDVEIITAPTPKTSKVKMLARESLAIVHSAIRIAWRRLRRR